MPKDWCQKSECCLDKSRILPKLGTNFNFSFLSFGALLPPTNSSHKNKIIAPNECIGMQYVAINQGPCQIQELTLTLVFYFI